MATPYTDLNAFPDQITIPDDGDITDASSVNVGLEGLANRTRYLYLLGGGIGIPYFYQHAALDTVARPTGNTGNYGFLGIVTADQAVIATSLTLGTLTPLRRSIAISHSRAVDRLAERDPNGWWAAGENELVMNSPAWKQRYDGTVAATFPRILVWKTRIPNGATLTSVSVFVQPATHVAVPATRPVLSARLVNVTNNVATPLGSTTDPNSTLAAYNAAHTITHTVSQVVTGTQLLMISFQGEEGANSLFSSAYASVGGIIVYPPVVTFTRQTIGED